jgi:hypothetical protein
MVKTNNTKPSTGKAANPASDFPDISLWSEEKRQRVLASLSQSMSPSKKAVAVTVHDSSDDEGAETARSGDEEEQESASEASAPVPAKKEGKKKKVEVVRPVKPVKREKEEKKKAKGKEVRG